MKSTGQLIKNRHGLRTMAILLVLTVVLRATGVAYSVLPTPENTFCYLAPVAWYNPYDPLQMMEIKYRLRRGQALVWDYPDSAVGYLNQVITQSKAAAYADGIAEGYTHLGLVAVGKGAFDSSFAFYDKVEQLIPFCMKSGLFRSAIYINIGVTHFYQGEYEQALYYYYLTLQRMLRSNSSNGNTMMAYNNLADLLLRMGQDEQAAYYIRQGEPLARSSGDTLMLAYFSANRGALLASRGKYADAEASFTEALAYNKRLNNQDIEQAAWMSLGKIRMQQHKPADAIPYLRQALAISSYPYYASLGSSYTLGEALYQTGQYKEAEKVLTDALDKAGKAGIRQDKPAALATLAAVYEETGQPAKALEQRKHYIALQDSLLNTEKIRAINTLEVKYRTSEKDRELVRKQLEIATQKTNLNRKNLWLVVSSGGVLLTGLLFLAVYYTNKQRQAIAILEAMMAGEEKERSRTAKELHDGIGGLLAAVQMQLSTIKAEGVAEISALMKNAAAEVRKTAHNLMPDVIQRYTFTEAVQMYCETINQAGTGLLVELQVHQPVAIGNKDVELSLYRIIQELLQNIVKHAAASCAVIQISLHHHRLTIMVEDNGIGFDTTRTGKGLGIHNLHLRVKLLKGSLALESAPGKGTTIAVSVPMQHLPNELI